MSSSETFPTASTYRAVFSLTDAEGDPLPVGADTESTFTYTIARTRGGEAIYQADPADIVIQPDEQTGVVEVTIEADEIFWTGVVIEELRLTRAGSSIAVSQRPVAFTAATTDP
jgi:hypothetical protein